MRHRAALLSSGWVVTGFAFLLVFGVARPAQATTDFENPLFGYTHMLPSPYTLPQGRFVVGTEVAFGLTDFFQVGTSILPDFYKVYNVEGKLGLIDTHTFALGLSLTYEQYNLHDIVSTNPNQPIKTWKPGAVVAQSIVDSLALFYGGNLNITNIAPVTSGIATSGYVTGAGIESDLSWAYDSPSGESKKSRSGRRQSQSSGRARVGHVLSAGFTYDVTYKVYGVGLSHHWPGFHVGLHYYPNATDYRVQPILAGGAVVEL